jgi:hypothetical protein
MEYKPYDAYAANPYQTDPYAMIQQAMQYQPPAQNYAPQAQLTPAYNTTAMNPFTAALMQRLSQNNNIQGLLNADAANPNLAQSPGLLSQGLAMPQGQAINMPTTGGPAATTNPFDYYRLNGDFWKNIYETQAEKDAKAKAAGGTGTGTSNQYSGGEGGSGNGGGNEGIGSQGGGGAVGGRDSSNADSTGTTGGNY